MADTRFLLWNVEWMNDLFVSGEEDEPAEFRPDWDRPDNTWHREWIDHVLHTGSEPWVTNASVHEHLPDGAPIWQKYPHASDHYPVSVTVST